MLLAVGAGGLVGVVMAAVGGGGAILTVPALVYLLSYRPYTAATAALVVVVTTAVAGAVVHWRGGRVRAVPGLAFGLLGVPAAWLGSRLAAGVPAGALSAAFALLLLAAATAMLRQVRAGVSAFGDGGGTDGRTAPAHPLAVAAAACGVGLLTGLLGVGGGFLVVPALVLLLGFPQPDATGTSLVAISVTASAALAGRAGHLAELDWTATGLLAAGALAGAVAGARLAGRLDPVRLRAAFAALLVAVAALTLVQLLR